MPDATYRLHDGELLRRLMKYPLPGGTVHTMRSLAKATGLSPGKIQKLISEERPDVTRLHADRIAAAVQIRRKALFSPQSFTFTNSNERKENPVDPDERTLRARLAAHTSWAKETDPTSRTAKARTAANEKFAKQAREMHPDASDARIAEVAEHLRKAHYARMGLASGKARRAKKTAAQKSARPAA